MKVGFVSTWDTLCGFAVYIRPLVLEFKKLGVEVKVFSEKDLPFVPRIKVPREIPYSKSWSRYDHSFKELEEAILEYSPDVVYFVHGTALFGLDSRLKTLVGNLSRSGIKVAMDLEVPLPEFVDYFNSLDVDAYLLVVTDLDLPLKNKYYIPFPAIPMSLVGKKIARKKLGIPLNSWMCLVTGFVGQQSGVEYLVRSFRLVANEIPDSRLYIVGGVHPWDRKYWLERGIRLARDLDLLDKNVFFTKRVASETELALYGSATDLFLNYRKDYPWKIFGGAIMRAVSCRKPVVAYDCYSIRNIPRGIVKISTEEEMARSIVQLYKDRDLYLKLKREMEDLYEERKYSRIARMILKILEELVG